MNGRYITRGLIFIGCLSFGACYFNQNCPQDLTQRISHDERGCVADIKEKEELETLLLLSILTGGFPGTRIDTSEEADSTDEDGGSGTGGT